MRFVRFIPHGRFHDSKPRAMPLDLTTIGFLAVVVVIIIVALVMPTVFHSWDRYPRPVEYFYPAYPQHELEQGIGGDVTVRFTINRLGEVASFQVLDDGGSDALAIAVREAVKAARYKAQRSGRFGDLPGLPIEVTVTQRFLFNAEWMANRERQYG
ncbi:energy transducer TonB [Gemmatimonadota bacterium]